MILCCGESLIDMLPRDLTDGGAGFAPHVGGAVFNTAIALGRLGAPVGLFSGVSRDLFGAMLADALTASKVETAALARSDRPTTLAFVTLTDGQARYAFYDEGTAGRMLTEGDLPQTAADAYFFGGISLVSEPCGSVYEALMAREAPRAVTMIDPNIRPSFIADEPAYRARIDRMLALADIVKLSDEDLHWLMGDGTTEAHANTLLSRGPKLVCITEGADGVTGYSGAHRIHVPAPSVTVADTVGAGDTFNAGLLAALHDVGALTKSRIAALSESDITNALALGAQTAAITVSRAGANPPWRTELT
ncbi:carbohydrate kinase family protein [Aliiroseovarius sp. YM-037]|uniref:carbohydrate kinase family protein n=1 Tax=Aliiroseovarius sp. YM-037 TaxID=3341728 RepID=UPI003A7FF743